MANGQPAFAGIDGRQGDKIPPPGHAGHRRIQPEGGVLPRDDVRHLAGRAGQHLAGIGIGQRQFQRTGGLVTRGAKNKPDGQQVFVG